MNLLARRHADTTALQTGATACGIRGERCERGGGWNTEGCDAGDYTGIEPEIERGDGILARAPALNGHPPRLTLRAPLKAPASFRARLGQLRTTALIPASPLDNRPAGADPDSMDLHDEPASASAFELFRQDAQRWVVPGEVASASDVTFRGILAMLYRHVSLRAMLWFRIGNWCQRRGIPGLPGIIQRHLYHRYGLDIVIGSEIAGGLYIAHPSGTVIAVDRIGRNCSIIASVTLGLRNEHAFPSIGDDVFIGAGARVLGSVVIGDGARIGANAVVIHDVPAGATAVGIPARVVGAREPARGL